MAPKLKCEHCNDVSGVYEPLIVVVGEDVCETFRAAEPSVASGPGERYHRTRFWSARALKLCERSNLARALLAQRSTPN
jgi:hypothetical protein